VAGSVLTSARNPKVAAATRLKKRAFREEDRSFLVEGERGVAEGLAAGALRTLFAVDELDAVVIRARQAGVDTNIVSAGVMGRLTSTVTPQGLVGISSFLDVGLRDVPATGCLAVLHQVRDPGNAGTVLRSSDAAGVTGVIFTASSVDVYNPKTVRASAGSLFHVPVVRGVPASTSVSDLRERGVRVIALDAAGDEDLYQTDLSGPIAFLLGNEAHGLPTDVRGLADVSVRVPHAGRAESLNLAAAATVCVFEWARRHRSEGPALESIIAAAAHDIRSPLTAMKGFGFALEQRWAQMTPAERALMLGGIVYDAERMDTVLRQLVDAARVFEGRFEAFPEQTDVPELVRQIGEMLARDPEHPSIEWSGSDVSAFVDPARLKTALLAFIDSAVWWGQAGPVIVRGSVEGGRLRLSVSRAGTELSSQGAQNLFLARRPGTGRGSKIGLYIARSVAEAQGGGAWGDVVDDVLVLHLELPVG
jgi:TrmH family RNA methyltransferase